MKLKLQTPMKKEEETKMDFEDENKYGSLVDHLLRHVNHKTFMLL